MGIFRRSQRVDGPTAANTTTNGRRHTSSQPYYSMATRPSFGQWLKYTWLDIVTMVCMGAIGLGVSSPSPQVPQHSRSQD